MSDARNMRDDDLITLEQACEVAFNGAVKVATLRAEASRGKLTLYRVGRRDFTTLREIKAMRERCRVKREAPTSTSIPSEEHGPSETEHARSAQAAARASVERLKVLSRNSSVVSIARSPARTR